VDVGDVFRLEHRPGEVEQVRELARAEVLEHRRLGEELVEQHRRKSEAEGVLDRAVGGEHASPRDVRGQREHLAGGKVARHRDPALRAFALAADEALADHVAVRRPVRSRGDDRLARREIAQLRAADEALAVGVAHRGERCVDLQRLLESGDDGRGGGGGSWHGSRRDGVSIARGKNF
jgi:hypothetical protein